MRIELLILFLILSDFVKKDLILVFRSEDFFLYYGFYSGSE